mmetsp:Transcript_27458/g.59619  ORF Transcript_27458/g.59619 Transcript_27458/m.59619 type:complete len:860 (-) Transcript_27458:161-2740(-)
MLPRSSSKRGIPAATIVVLLSLSVWVSKDFSGNRRSNAAATIVVRAFSPPPSRSAGFGFTSSSTTSSTRSSTALSVSQSPRSPSSNLFNPDPNSGGDDDARTDVKLFLTQRSIQSLLYLLRITNDGISAGWLEDYLHPSPGDGAGGSTSSSDSKHSGSDSTGSSSTGQSSSSSGGGSSRSGGSSNHHQYHGTAASYLTEFGSTEEIIVGLIESEVVLRRVILGPRYGGRGSSGSGGDNMEGGEGARRGSRTSNAYLDYLSGSGTGGNGSSSNAEGPTGSTYSPYGRSEAAAGSSVGGDAKKSEKKKTVVPGSLSYLDSLCGSGDDEDEECQIEPPLEGVGEVVKVLEVSQRDAVVGSSSVSSSSGGSRGEAFQRALLAARLRNRMTDTAGATTTTTTTTNNNEKMMITTTKKKMDEEQFHRSLLEARFQLTARASSQARTLQLQARERFQRSLLSHRITLQLRDVQRARLMEQLRISRSARETGKESKARTKSNMSKNNNKSKKDVPTIGIDRRRLAEDRERALSHQERTNPYVKSTTKTSSSASSSSSLSSAAADDDEDEGYYYMDLEIEPMKLVTKLLAVREQIAVEFVDDLILIWKADKALLGEMMMLQTTAELDEAAAANSDAVEATDDSTTAAGDNDEDGPSSSSPSALLSKAIQMHQEKLSYLSTGKASSPFRKNNFDLLYNLCTQASIHRLLRRLMSDGGVSSTSSEGSSGAAERAAVKAHRDASFAWLRDFYVDRVATYFDGHVQHGRADAFFAEWMDQTVVPISSSSSPSSTPTQHGLDHVDPARLAEEMVRIRSDVVMEWRRSMRMVPEQDHGWLRLFMMEKRMTSSSEEEEDGTGGNGDGGFAEEGFQ